MKPYIREFLSALPPLTVGPTQAVSCKMCSAETELFAAVDFQKHCDAENPYQFGKSGLRVEYLRCKRCEFLFTTFFDEWTPQDFSAFIYNDDYLKVDPEYVSVRPERTATHMANTLSGAERLRILDYGSGSGVFARRMMGLGYSDVDNYDPFSSPGRPVGKYDLITAFEVIEHSTDPDGTISDMLSYLGDGGCLIVGQTLQPADISVLRGDWWYLGPRNGHVSTFSPKTLEMYAAAKGIRFFEGVNIFGLSRINRSDVSAEVLSRITKTRHHRRIMAPAPDGVRHTGWHTPERDGNAVFRWTSMPEVSFGLHRFEQGETVLTIPLHIAASRAFINSCVVQAGDVELRATVSAEALTATFTFGEALVAPVLLKTPMPSTPYDRDGTLDARPLGLAITCST